MKNSAWPKQIGMLALVLGFAVGCAQQQTATEVEDEPCTMSAQVRNAIEAAKAANAEAQALGAAWRDTDALIKRAIAAGNDCENDEALALAEQAKQQAEAAIKQYQDQQAATEQPAPADDSYTVLDGDSLWGISALENIYSDPYQWPLIYKANADQIEDADLIFPGQVFAITRSNLSAQVEAAIQHAKTRGAWSIGTTEDSDRAYLAANN